MSLSPEWMQNMRHKRRSRTLISCLIALALLVPLAGAYGWGTVLWQVDTAEQLEEGDLDQVMVSSLGEVKLGSRLTKVSLEDIALVWAVHQTKGGEVYLGTGNNGQVLRLDGTGVEEIAKLDCLVVTALASDEAGALYAGTLPDGKIYRLEPAAKGPAKSKLLVDLEKADHVWDLRYDTKRKVLFAATGPKGIVYSVSPAGRADLFYESSEDHALSLLLEAPGGDLIVGTSPKALLLRVSGPGRALALHDFDATEVKGIAAGDDGALYLAVNKFPEPPSVSKSRSSKSKRSRGRPKPGKGKIFRRMPDGSVEPLLEFDDGHLTSIETPGDGLVYAGTGAKGRVVAVDDERVTYTTMDVEERQVTVLSLGGKQPLIATGDVGSVYRVEKGTPGLAEYRSGALDAGFVSRWGLLEWRAEGQLVVQTRSGNTEEPNETWSDWSPPLARSGVQVKSPPARYLQVRFRWSRDPGAVLRSFGVFHLPHNQRPVVTEIEVETPFEVERPLLDEDDNGRSRRKGGRSKRDDERSPVVKLSWEVDNPDDDALRYRLYFRPEAGTIWQAILPEEQVLTKTSFEWNTDPVPAGRYLIKVRASDEPDNPADLALHHDKISPPVVIDNDPPRLEGLAAKGRRIRGKARDDVSPIAALEYSLDGQVWRPIFPADRLFDELEESFELDLPPEVGSGPKVIAIRAYDRAKNAAIGRLATTVP